MDGKGGDVRYGRTVLALTLVALSVGLPNLAAAIGIGAGGVDRATRRLIGGLIVIGVGVAVGFGALG